MAVPTVDLNADLGEGGPDDAGLLEVVTSANVACGYHAGDAVVMRSTCALAAELGVVVGAQVSYADRENFGRVAIDVPAATLRQQVADQVGALGVAAEACGTRVRYLKPHGALYHRVAVDDDQAAAVLAGSGELPVLGMAGSRLLALAAAAGRGVRLEGFPDRGYDPDGALLPRDRPGAVLTDAGEVAEQALELAATVDSLCLHGDTPGAVRLARAVRRRLTAAGWTLAGCWDR